MSSPSYMPVSDAFPNPQDGQDWPKGWSQYEVNTYYAIQHAAGSVHPSPLPSTSSPTLANYSFDAWAALFNTDCFSGVNAGSYSGAPILGSPSSNGSQESSSTPPSLLTPPLGDDTSPYLPTPEQLFHPLSNPFSITDGSQGLGDSVQYNHDLIAQWLHLPGFSPPGRPPQDELIAADILSIANQEPLNTTTNGIVTPPSNFVAPPTTMLGLYYPNASQSLGLTSLPIQANNNVSLPSAPERVATPPRSAEGWTFRPVDPSPNALRSKRAARNVETQPSDAVSPSMSDSQVEQEMKCDVCGYVPLKKRKGDLHRHQMKHEAAHLSRVVCCGVPYTFSLASRHPGYFARWYANRPFYGGCGRTYSRMDALQRHMKKSGCLGGSARDHQAWRKLYFPVETRRRG